MSTTQLADKATLEIVEQSKASFIRAKEQLTRALSTTPNDRINWSPSSTARTPIQQVAHAANAIEAIKETLDGRPFQAESISAADAAMRANEKGVSTREEALALLEKSSENYLALLDSLTPERLNTEVVFPFGLGKAPLATTLNFASAHMMGHAAQIDYIQTIYGDHDWHLPSQP